jgi:hypothetical protein
MSDIVTHLNSWMCSRYKPKRFTAAVNRIFLYESITLFLGCVRTNLLICSLVSPMSKYGTSYFRCKNLDFYAAMGAIEYV